MTQSPENGQKPHFGPNFDHFGHNIGPFFSPKSDFLTLNRSKKASLMQKNEKNLTLGSMRTLSDRLTADGLTDGAGFIMTHG